MCSTLRYNDTQKNENNQYIHTQDSVLVACAGSIAGAQRVWLGLNGEFEFNPTTTNGDSWYGLSITNVPDSNYPALSLRGLDFKQRS